jgi:peptidylprolyl isomerase
MAPKDGDTVRVHYRGTLEDGTEFDSSTGGEPLVFVVGSGEVIPGFDTAVRQLEPGATATVTIPAADAYGDHDPEGVQHIPLTAFPEQPQEGWAVEFGGPNGERAAAVIASVGAETVIVDFNHPLAGKDLTFEIELVEVVEG